MTSLFETFLRISGYNLQAARKRLRSIQQMDVDAFKLWQSDSKWKIARFHYENNEVYKRKVGPKFPDRWEDLPIMQKTDFQEDMDKLLSRGYSQRTTYTANTSGSSGHPFYFAKDKAAHALDWALIQDRYQQHGLSLSSRQVRFYGIPLERISFWTEKVKDLIMNRVRFPVFDLSEVVLEQYLQLFRRKSFDYIYGYTNSLVLFARFIIDKQLVLKDVCPCLKVCICTSEVLTAEDRDILSAAFGIPVVNEYGASEVGLLAFESPQREWLLCEETLFIETLSSEDIGGNEDEGHLIVTDLDNFAMPFIRYNIGDIGIIGKESETDGKYRKLDRLLGRENDTIVLPGGKKSPGLTFYYISRAILESSGILKEFIIRQTALDTFVFDVISKRDLNSDEISIIHEKMDQYLEPGLNLEINQVQEIKRSLSGKIKHFYSELT